MWVNENPKLCLSNLTCIDLHDNSSDSLWCSVNERNLTVNSRIGNLFPCNPGRWFTTVILSHGNRRVSPCTVVHDCACLIWVGKNTSKTHYSKAIVIFKITVTLYSTRIFRPIWILETATLSVNSCFFLSLQSPSYQAFNFNLLNDEHDAIHPHNILSTHIWWIRSR